MKKRITLSVLMLCFLTSIIGFGQEVGDAISVTDRSNCGKKDQIAKVDFERDQDGETTQILVVCGADLEGPAVQACLDKLGSDNLTGDDFKCGPCEIEKACQLSMQELYKGNDTNQYDEDDVSPNPNPSSTFTILGIQFCIHDVGCKTYPGENKWKAKFECSECEWPKQIEQIGLRNLEFPKEHIEAIQEGYNVNPNPSDGQFNLKIANTEFENSLSFIVFDQTGKLVFEKEFNNSNQVLINDQVNLEDVSSGLYFYTVVVDGLVLPAKKLSVVK